MNFNIDKNLPLSIKAQLKRQILGMIHTGVILPGESMPSCNDLSGMLSVNRNTVAGVYAELAAEGVLVSNRGGGTIVSKTLTPKPMNALKTLMETMFVRAKELGFSNEEITDQFFSAIAAQASQRQKTVLLIWCNPFTLVEVGEKVESDLGVNTVRLLLDEVKKDTGRLMSVLSTVDLVVTSINYVADILPYAEEAGKEVAGVILTPVTRILNEMIRLPRGSTVGFVCVNAVAAQSTCKSVSLSGQITMNTIWAGADDPEGLKRLISKCDMIFATHHVYVQVCQLAGAAKKVVNVDVSITKDSIEMIREQLESISTGSFHQHPILARSDLRA